MTVEVLRLSGLPAAAAGQAAARLLDVRTGPRDLSRLLAVDDTALLVEHAPAYDALFTANRVARMLCVAVGPRPTGSRALQLPGNLGGTQGAGVLWVGDPIGIDWRVAAAAVARGRVQGKETGLAHLIELLSVEGLFDQVNETLEEKVPGRIASPGLKLAGADDEAATFAAALSSAIRRIGESSPGNAGPYLALLPEQAGGAAIARGGPLGRYRDQVIESARAAETQGRIPRMGGLLRRDGGTIRQDADDAGTALASMRELIAQLLRDANTVTGLTETQRRLVQAAGISFPPASAHSAPVTASAAVERSLVCRTVADAITGGDTLTEVSRCLTLTEREVKRRGSASYLPEIEQRCPSELLERLFGKPHRDSGRGRHSRDLGIADAVRAAQSLADLVVTVANREWSLAADPGELARVRIAVDGARKALAEHAGRSGVDAGSRGARLARIGEDLLPVLRLLVIQAVATEVVAPSATGHEAFTAASDRTGGLLADWVQYVHVNGLSAVPPFAADRVPGITVANEADVADVREALLYPAAHEMWQLCGPTDLGALNSAVPPLVVRFASRLSRAVLAGSLPGDDPVWTSSGSFAGQLRLVPLRPGMASSSWASVDRTALPDSPAVGDPFVIADNPAVSEPS